MCTNHTLISQHIVWAHRYPGPSPESPARRLPAEEMRNVYRLRNPKQSTYILDIWALHPGVITWMRLLYSPPAPNDFTASGGGYGEKVSMAKRRLGFSVAGTYKQTKKWAHILPATDRGLRALAILAAHELAKSPKTPKRRGTPKDASRYDLALKARELRRAGKSWEQTKKQMNRESGEKLSVSAYRKMVDKLNLVSRAR